MVESIVAGSLALAGLESLNQTNTALNQGAASLTADLKLAVSREGAPTVRFVQTLRSQVGSVTAIREAIGTGEATLEVAVTAGRRVRDVLLKLRDKAAKGSDPELVNDLKTMVLGDFETVSNDLDRVAGDEDFCGATANLDTTTRTKLSDDPDTLIEELRNIAKDANFTGINVTLDAESRTKLSSEFDNLLAELKDVVDEADFNGINLVAAGARDIEFVTDRKGNTATVEAQDLSAAGLDIDDLSVASGIGAAQAVRALDQAIATVSDRIGGFEEAATQAANTVELSDELLRVLDKGVSLRVDTELSDDDANLLAAEVRSRLGVTSLSVANAKSETLLSLIR